MDHYKVWEVLCIPVDKSLIAVVVDKNILVNVQVVLAAKHFLDDGLCWFDRGVLQRLILPVGPDVVTINCCGCRACEGTGQACNLVLGELQKKLGGGEYLQQQYCISN